MDADGVVAAADVTGFWTVWTLDLTGPGMGVPGVVRSARPRFGRVALFVDQGFAGVPVRRPGTGLGLAGRVYCRPRQPG